MANEYWQVFTTDQDDTHIPNLEGLETTYPERTILAPATGWFELQAYSRTRRY